MRIARLVLGIGDQYLRPSPSDDSYQLPDHYFDIGVGKGLRMIVLLAVRHAAVAIAEPYDLSVSDYVSGGLQLSPGARPGDRL